MRADVPGGPGSVLPNTPMTRSREIGGDYRATPMKRLQALHEVLLPGDLWDRVAAAHQVIVVPDGALYQLPFEALVTRIVDPEVESDMPRPVYWLDEGPLVRYSASATVLANLEERTFERGSAGVVSLSDPIFDPVEITRMDGDREVERSGATRSEALRATFERGGGALSRLPGTALETDAILERFDAADVVVLQEAEAGEPELRAALGGQRYLHLATHGLVDERRASMFASLALTPPVGATTDHTDDGFLQLHEIYELDLDGTELAVLSACETNVGEDVVGEGVFALSRGFLVAGARRVIASQWPVADESTAMLIGALFDEISAAEAGGEGVEYARALRNAQLAVRNDGSHPEWADPYHWAPFVLTGAR